MYIREIFLYHYKKCFVSLSNQCKISQRYVNVFLSYLNESDLKDLMIKKVLKVTIYTNNEYLLQWFKYVSGDKTC